MSGLNTKGVLSANLNQQAEIVAHLNENGEEKYMPLALINSHLLLCETEELKSKHFVEFNQSASHYYFMTKSSSRQGNN